MPRKRRLEKRRFDRLTFNQRSILECGVAFCPGLDPGFDDDDHYCAAWAAHRDLILAEWSHLGRRPDAMWLLDFGLREVPAPKKWPWPRPIQTEEEMVRDLLLKGEIEPCRFNGVNRITSEVEEIERSWLHEIGTVVTCCDELPAITRPLTTWGTPVWFAKEHAARVWAEDRERWRRWHAERDRLASGGGQPGNGEAGKGRF